MRESQLVKIIDDLKRELLTIKKRLAKIDERHYKNDTRVTLLK